MNRTKIRFYQGLDTIGGVILEIKYGKDRAFFEAGMVFNPSFDMFDSKVNKRKQFISDYLWTNDLPQIDGIYREQDIVNTNLKSAKDYEGKQAFFISHLHLDHMKMMGMIDPSIPVYISKNAQIIESALEDVGQGVDTIRSNYNDMQEDTQIGDIKVHRFILNDDSYQDYSFYIQTPDLKIHFTSDIFVYGKYFNNIKDEIKYINDTGVDILIPEGTTFWGDVDKDIVVEPTYTPNDLLTKDDTDKRLIDLIKQTDGLVVFNHYEREMSDVMDLLNYAQLSSRTLVFEPEAAYIANKFFNNKFNIIIPDTYRYKPKYLDEIITKSNVISKNDIINNPNKYLLHNSYQNILELIDYKNLNTLYLHISGTPIGAFDPKFKNMMTILDSLGFKYHNRSDFDDNKYFSSHATREQLLQYLSEVKCKLIVPCHSANRIAYMNNIHYPKFYAQNNITYEYDEINNTLKESTYV